MTWTTERIETLTELWKAGKSASYIASMLGDATRNSVMGKISRLGLSGHGGAQNKGPARVRKSIRFRMKPPHLMIVPAEPAKNIPMQDTFIGVPLLEVRDGQCRWPHGDPQKPGFCLCGSKTGGAPYCLFHTRIAHRQEVNRYGSGIQAERSMRRR
jgi:GcrA cell cycle regulator